MHLNYAELLTTTGPPVINRWSLYSHWPYRDYITPAFVDLYRKSGLKTLAEKNAATQGYWTKLF